VSEDQSGVDGHVECAPRRRHDTPAEGKTGFRSIPYCQLLNEELNQLQRDVRWVAEMNDRKVLPNKVWLLIVHWQSPAA